MGWWKLKTSEQLDPYNCLRIDLDDVLDFVIVDVKEGYELTEVDKEHIYNQIRKEWNVAGELNDWDDSGA